MSEKTKRRPGARDEAALPAGKLEGVVDGGIWQAPGLSLPEDADDYLLDTQLFVVGKNGVGGELHLHAIFAAEDGAVARGCDAGLSCDYYGADPILPALAVSFGSQP